MALTAVSVHLTEVIKCPCAAEFYRLTAARAGINQNFAPREFASRPCHAVNELCETRPWNAYPDQAKRTESPVQIVRFFLLADHTRGDAMDGTVGGITQFIVIVAANKGMDRY